MQNGHRVWLGGCGPRRPKELAGELKAGSSDVVAAVPGTIDECLDAAAAPFGCSDGVADCIGSLLLRPIHAMTDDEWNETLLAKHGSTFATVRADAVSAGLHVLGRLGEPADVALLIEGLLHPENRWITGQVIGIDGGLGRVLPRTRVRT